jgi:gamma-glutamyltranspeptidase / glutathione hydrolase
MFLDGNALSNYPYPASRRVVLGQRGAVATGQPLASLAGMEMLLAGGSAVDAAIAMAITLTVVEPTGNGLGSDAFALVWDTQDGQLHGLNASGRSPNALNPEDFLGHAMPRLGWETVTVPGAVSAWQSLWQRWGKLPFADLFAPAIRYAEQGFGVSPTIAQHWQRLREYYLTLSDPVFAPFQAAYFPQRVAPVAGSLWQQADLAETLRAIASSGGESFYRGGLAQAIIDYAAQTGGLLSQEDLASHQPEWVQPLCTDYRGYTVWEIPPNGQGIAALMALNILEGFELTEQPRETAQNYHYQLEAQAMPSVSSGFSGGFSGSDTVYLAAADETFMVSFIQSNYMSFGSGILIPGTGITLHNRGTGFSCMPGHPNQVAAGKRPRHTILPGFLSRAGQPIGPFGVMGGPMQPQGHVQMVVNMVDFQLNPQAALDAPRWHYSQGCSVLLESTVPAPIAQRLAEWGHAVTVTAESSEFGKGQIICRSDRITSPAMLVAGSEPRADGLALDW